MCVSACGVRGKKYIKRLFQFLSYSFSITLPLLLYSLFSLTHRFQTLPLFHFISSRLSLSHFAAIYTAASVSPLALLHHRRSRISPSSFSLSRRRKYVADSPLRFAGITARSLYSILVIRVCVLMFFCM